MIAAWLLLTVVCALLSWATDNGWLAAAALGCVLMALFSALGRDARQNHAVLYDIDEERRQRAHGYYQDAA